MFDDLARREGLPLRRTFVLGAPLMLGACVTHGSATGPARSIPSDYAESVMLVIFSPDGRRDLSVRLWRLIHQRKATIWGAYSDEVGSFRMADEAPLPPLAAPTDVDQDRAAFSHVSSWRSQFERRGRQTAQMRGQVLLAAGLHASSDPPPGEGPLPGLIRADFRAVHAPVLVRPGRMEVFGRGRAKIRINGRRFDFEGLAKWHEQVGPRPGFGPAFTYVALTAGDAAFMTTKTAAGVAGFVARAGQIRRVVAMDINELAPERRISATLDDGDVFTATAKTVRVSSEPIEGRRRPGAAVVASTSLGDMVGQINDWRPQD